MNVRTVALSVGLLGMLAGVAGCSSYSDIQPGYDEHLDSQDDYQQSEEYLEAEGDYYAEQQEAEYFASRGWQCFWDPTMNDDWHDDYLCSSGVNSVRPYLLPDDDFVEGWEIDTAAAEYEAYLNEG